MAGVVLGVIDVHFVWQGLHLVTSRDDAVLCACANARFPTEYDSKGHGLMRLAGHTPRHWPVSSRPCDCRTFRPALHCVAWEAFTKFPSHAPLSYANAFSCTCLFFMLFVAHGQHLVMLHSRNQHFQHLYLRRKP